MSGGFLSQSPEDRVRVQGWDLTLLLVGISSFPLGVLDPHNMAPPPHPEQPVFIHKAIP